MVVVQHVCIHTYIHDIVLCVQYMDVHVCVHAHWVIVAH